MLRSEGIASALTATEALLLIRLLWFRPVLWCFGLLLAEAVWSGLTFSAIENPASRSHWELAATLGDIARSVATLEIFWWATRTLSAIGRAAVGGVGLLSGAFLLLAASGLPYRFGSWHYYFMVALVGFGGAVGALLWITGVRVERWARRHGILLVALFAIRPVSHLTRWFITEAQGNTVRDAASVVMSAVLIVWAWKVKPTATTKTKAIL